MLIPKQWAQYKQRFESSLVSDGFSKTKQATIKRYGWSDSSQSEALAHAKARVADAHSRWLAGEDILRREREEEYNERNGIPIREQIISEQTFSKDKSSSVTQVITTRNSYGAQVANVDNIAIIDIDDKDLLRHLYSEQYLDDGFMPAIIAYKNKSSSKIPVWVFIIVFMLIAIIIAWLGISWLWLLPIMFGATVYLWYQADQRDKASLQKHYDNVASLQPFLTDLIQKRIARHPNESFRLYETPAGFRVIATHSTVLPNDSVVTEWFEYFHTDTNYVRLCQAQQCFRARLTAKPWRMSEVAKTSKLDKNIPAKDFWFGSDNTGEDNSIEQRQEALKARKQWIADYDRFAQNYRACDYIERFAGKEVSQQSASVAIKDFVAWHDRACRVGKALPLA